MSGSLGSWPISPAAKPANPAPSSTRSSRFAAGTSFALGRAVHVDELREEELDSALLRRSSWISSSLGSSRRPWRPPCGWPPGCITRPEEGEGGFLHISAAGHVCGVSVSRASRRRDHLHGDLHHQPVVAPEIDAGEVADPPQTLAQRVRVDEEGVGGGADVPAPGEELLERASRELRCARGRTRRASRPRRSSSRGRPDRARSGAGTCTRRARRSSSRRCRGRITAVSEERMPRLLESVRERLGADTDARHPDGGRRLELAWTRSSSSTSLPRRPADRDERADSVWSRVSRSVPRASERDRLLERSSAADAPRRRRAARRDRSRAAPPALRARPRRAAPRDPRRSP